MSGSLVSHFSEENFENNFITCQIKFFFLLEKRLRHGLHYRSNLYAVLLQNIIWVVLSCTLNIKFSFPILSAHCTFVSTIYLHTRWIEIISCLVKSLNISRSSRATQFSCTATRVSINEFFGLSYYKLNSTLWNDIPLCTITINDIAYDGHNAYFLAMKLESSYTKLYKCFQHVGFHYTNHIV